jgi:hypothetical protein
MTQFVSQQIWPFARTLVTLAACVVALRVMIEFFRNLWLNWGQQYPLWSSFVIAVGAVATWWLFGLAMWLSDPSLHKSNGDAATAHSSQTPSVSATAIPADITPSQRVTANGVKLPGWKAPEEPKPKAVKSGVQNSEIYSLFSKGDTSLKVSRALEPYVGTVMTIEGKLIQIHGGSGGGPIALSMFVNNGPGASCVFDGEWLDHLDALKRDQQITVRGKIRPEPAGNDLQLIECELLASRPPATPSPTAKSALDRIHIRDTPDGAILEVENLEPTPTATPETGPRNVPPKIGSASSSDPGPRVVPPTAAQREQMANLEQKLANLLEKAKRLDDTPDSPGFDIPAAKVRNQKLIGEVRDQIARLNDKPQETPASHPLPTSGGVVIGRGKNISFEGCVIEDNEGPGIGVGDVEGLRVTDTLLARNKPQKHFRALRPVEIRDLIDRLISDGQSLIELWETHLKGFVSLHQRRFQSTNWLSKASHTVKEHLTIQQFDKFTNEYDGAMGERWKLSLRIIRSDVETSSDDYKLAFEVAGKTAVLRELREEITRLS